LLNQVNRLGFGATTTIGFPGESAGLLIGQSSWHASDLASLPIGQVDAVTPIQVLDAYNCIANGGVFIEPNVLRATIGLNGVPTVATPPLTYRVFTSSVAQTLNNMLQDVVKVGTGEKAIIPGYAVAGKTGTAAMPKPGAAAYVTGAYNASFVGFAPADHPTLSMIVLIQRPVTSIFGGDAAAPVFQRVMSYALRHYGVPLSGTFRHGVNVAAGVSSDVTQ
jgi:cell division protein FtsI (penicillin-binding protein 3)